MKTIKLIQCLMLASIIPFSSFMVANDDVPDEEKQITMNDLNSNDTDGQTLSVPVTASLSNNVLNVHVTGNIPTATISVQNALTGATVNRQTLTGVQGVTFSVPVSGLTMGTVTVTNEQSGESVSGDFEVEE